MASLALASLSRLDLKGAIIFADDRVACSLAWAVGLPALLELGVVNVLRLGDPDTSASPPLSIPDPTEHAIILCSTFLPEAYSSMRASLCQVCARVWPWP